MWTRIDDDAVICPHCGVATHNFKDATQPQQPQQPAPQVIVNNSNVNTNTNTNANGGMVHSRKSKMVALLLAIFLGYFGCHRFYVGKIGTGIIWLCTGGFFGVGWIVDIVMIAMGAFKDKLGLPLV